MNVFAPLLETDFLPMAELAALDIVSKDRQQYAALNELILNYCREARLILSDRNVLAGSTDDPMIIYDYRIQIYTAYPVFHANALANLIYQKMPESRARSVMRVKTVRYGEELHIEYDTRIMAIIYKLQAHRNDEPYDVVRPVDVGGLSYFPPEIELIDICYTQYNPARVADRERDIAFFDTFYEQADRRRTIVKGGKLQGIAKVSKTGAYKITHNVLDNSAPINTFNDDVVLNDTIFDSETPNEARGGDCRDLRRQFIEGFKVSLVTDFLPNYNEDVDEPLVLLGVWAVAHMKHGRAICANPEKVQVVGQISPEKLLSAVTNYAARLSSNKIIMRKQNLHIPKDFRTVRTTYYMAVDVDRRTIEKPFLDLFNCADFECVPYAVVDKLCIADHWMIMRFLLIDMWIVRMVYSMQLINADIFKKKMDELWTAFSTVRTVHEKLYGDAKLQWTGVFRNAKIDKKISDQSSKKAIPYYPEMYAARHSGQLREISK